MAQALRACYRRGRMLIGSPPFHLLLPYVAAALTNPPCSVSSCGGSAKDQEIEEGVGGPEQTLLESSAQAAGVMRSGAASASHAGWRGWNTCCFYTAADVVIAD